MNLVLSRILLLLLWALIATLSVYFFLDNVIAYFYGYRSPNFGRTFFNNQFWVVLHMVGGTITLFTGPLQFWKGLRLKWPAIHRATGKAYMIGVTLAAAAALRLSVVSYCVPCRISLFLLTIFVMLSTWLAWKCIQTRNIEGHRKFMVRSYICVLAFVAVRVDDLVPLDFLFGAIEDSTFRRVVNEYFFSFVPLLMGEIFLTWLPGLKSSRSSQI